MVEGPGATNNAKKSRALVGRRLEKDVPAFGLVAGATLTEVLCLGKEVWLVFATAAPPAPAPPADEDDDDVVDLCGDDGIIDLCSSDDDVAPPAPAAPPAATETAVRLHFGMSGSLLLDGAAPRSPRALEQFRCHLDGGRSLAVFGDATTGGVTRADAAAARAKVAARAHLDVCSDRFDAARAAERLAREGSKAIAAALMDQNVSPGTGNIIKIESLSAWSHQSGSRRRRGYSGSR